MSAGADRSRELSYRDSLPCSLETFKCTTKFVVHESHFHSERCWLRMDAMASPRTDGLNGRPIRQLLVHDMRPAEIADAAAE